MDEAFEKLKQEGKTDVESLIKWMKESKVINDSKAMEDKARALLNEAPDKSNVELAKFQEVLGKLAADQKSNVDDWKKSLATHGKTLLVGGIMAGAAVGLTTAKDTVTSGAQAGVSSIKDALMGGGASNDSGSDSNA